MGDDLGDHWDAGSIGSSGDEDIPAAASVASGLLNTKKIKGNKQSPTTAGHKRRRAPLDGRGKDDNSGSQDERSEDEEEEGSIKQEDGEANRAEEELKAARAAKKKAKLKQLKARVRERKRRKEDGNSPETEHVAEKHPGGGVLHKQATELWASFCKVRGNLVSPLELDTPWITAGCLTTVDAFGAHTLPKLAGFIKASIPDWKTKIQNRNSKAPKAGPAVLIVCAGARRCVEVIKSLTAFRCQVVKLFAKHLKIEEQKIMLQKACFPIAVGTPGRMQALAAVGSLRLDTVSLLIFDMNKNIKGRDVLDMDGVATDSMKLLADYVRPTLQSSGVGNPSVPDTVANKLRIALY